jgi:hypothetical protein
MPLIDQEVLVSRFRLAAVALATMVASLVLVAGAQARDRNHDRIPDRWERQHHLSLHRDQARRDQDHDGLRNRGEFRARLNPRDADSDNDGIEDGDEHAGTISAFDGTTLTIALAGGGSITGLVTDTTEIKCEGAGTARAADRGPGGDDPSGDDRGDDHGDDEPGDDRGEDEPGDDHGDDPAGDDQGDDPAGHDQGDDHGDDGEACGTGALQTGTAVREAELRLRSGAATFKEIELRP